MNTDTYILRAYRDNELRGTMSTADEDGQVEFFITEHQKLGNEVLVYSLIRQYYAPQHISSQPSVKREYIAYWYNDVSLHRVLADIGGWQVGCENAIEVLQAVTYVFHAGWITHRTHYSAICPEGIEAYEVTDAGMEKIEEWGGDVSAAIKKREWYRANSSKPVFK